MLTLMLLAMGAVGANAQDAEEDKVYATFESPTNTGTTWDADTWTFGWNGTSYNQLHNIGLPSGNLTGYSKLVVDCSDMTSKFRILIYKGNDNFTLWVTEDGVTEFVLTEAVTDMSYLTGCTEICLSGPNWEGTAPGSVKINSMYLVKAQDPLAAEKGALSDMIARAGFCNGVGKTEASYAAFTSALEAANTALVDADATAESLTNATTALETAINGLTLAEGWMNLTKDMFKTWTSHDATEGTVNSGCAYELNVSSNLPFGLSTVDWLNYANLTGYEKLYVTVTAGAPRFCFNRLEDGGQDNDDESLSKMIDIPNNSRSTANFQTKDGDNTYIIDLKAIAQKDGFAILHCIKGANWANVTVTGMYLYDPLLTQKEALKEKIADASRYSSDYYSATSYEALQTAIAAAEAALAAAGATAESLTAAGEALDAAVAGLQINEGYRELVAEDFFQWDAVQNPTSREAANGAYEIGTATQMPYGDPSVSEFKYANLKQYDKLIVTVSAGTPRFMFNRDVDGGQWSATESESHLIEYPKGDDVWSSKYFSNEGNTYIVDLKQMYEDKGFVNLNAIKGANWADVTITGMYLYKEDAPDTYGIIGPLVGGWDDSDEKEMTESLMGIYTYTFPDEFQATESSYTYKLRANKVWGGYELPASGQPDKTWTPEEVGGYYNLTIKADVLTNSLEVEAVPVTVAHTATFTTNLDWDDVYAFVWTEGKKNFLGDWPGTKLEAVEGVYTVNFESTKGGVAPEQIIFNNGKEGDEKEQTSDLAYEDNKAYTWNLNYYVMSEDFFGSWDASEAGKMTKNADGTYTLNMENQVLSANTNKEYKVMKDLGGTTTWYPDGDNKKIEIKMDATYDIAITIDPANDNAVSEAMSVYKTVSDAGYATYCTPYALNFVDSGLKAYFAKKDENDANKVNFYEIFNAPAQTGLLLKAASGTYKLKMEAVEGEAAANVDGNLLTGVLVEQQVAAGSFVLLNGDKGVGFYKTNKEFTVGANTAYIAAQSGDARSFIGFDFDDNTTTAIEGVATVKESNGEIYNLQGQRVVKAQKGLYIIDGKKVILK